MGFLGFESKEEKEQRLNTLDRENEKGRIQAENEGTPFFGLRYEDDYRKSSN